MTSIKRKPGEIWKYYPYADKVCLVSNLGRVARLVKGKWGLVKPHTRNGYEYVPVAKREELIPDEDGKIRTRIRAVHRLVLETFDRKRRPVEVCRHLNGIVNSNKLSNLRWGTQQENIDDKYRHGTVPFGEDHMHTSLTNKEAREIASSKLDYGDLSKKYGCSKSTVREIKKGNYFAEATRGVKRIVYSEQRSLQMGNYSARSKCDENVAKAIYLQHGMNNLEIAAKYNVSEHIVGAIRRGRRYKNVTANLKLGVPSNKPLSKQDLMDIRNSSKSAKQLAKIYGIGLSTVYNIINRNAGY